MQLNTTLECKIISDMPYKGKKYLTSQPSLSSDQPFFIPFFFEDLLLRPTYLFFFANFRRFKE